MVASAEDRSGTCMHGTGRWVGTGSRPCYHADVRYQISGTSMLHASVAICTFLILIYVLKQMRIFMVGSNQSVGTGLRALCRDGLPPA